MARRGRPRKAVATAGKAVAAAGPGTPEAGSLRRAAARRRLLVGAAFLAPALVLLGALVVYPIFFTFVRSLFDRSGDGFTGVSNYRDMFTSSRTLTAIKNNAIWVAVAPTVVTAIGLVFAVLTERVKWSTAFKVAVFMPMAISFLSAGVIWRVVYEREPERGLLNAASAGIVEVFRPPGDYPGARPSTENLRQTGDEYVTADAVSPGDTVSFGLVAISPGLVPEDAQAAGPPATSPADSVQGVVWLDFTRGGGGERGIIDPTEVGLPNVRVEALDGDQVVASVKTAQDGSFVIDGLAPGSYRLRLAESNFREPFAGISWLGPSLVTPAVIVAYVWIWAGFAMVVIGAGLAAIPRDVLEAARVDGGSEWQVFRRVTIPLLAPVLAVVFVTLVINVLKIFDLVFVIPPIQTPANVIALEMWRVSFGGAQNQGLGSALAVFLFVLVIPAMAFNIRRFRTEA